MNDLERYFPGLVVFAAGVLLLCMALPSRESEDKMQLSEFAKLPVVDQGRVKPIDTVARTSLMLISNRESYKDADGNTQPAIRWLLDLMNSRFGNEAALTAKVFRIENDEVLNLLGLEARPGFYRYAWNEFIDKRQEIAREVARAASVDEKERNTFDVKILHLRDQMQLFDDLATLKKPLLLPPLGGEVTWQSLAPRTRAQAQEMLRLTRGTSDGPDKLRRLAFRHHVNILRAYTEGDAAKFNEEVAEYHKLLTGEMPTETSKADFETFVNHFSPFHWCSVLYLCVFLLAALGWLGWTGPLNRAALWLLMLTVGMHTLALLARMYLMDRPLVLVTNLYSSALVIGWGCALAGIVLERTYRNGIGNVVAGMLGFLTLLIAPGLAESGQDTLEMMRAVLDTNFWLATHVTCVTIGYTATFVAGFLGVVYILRGVFTTSLDARASRTLAQMMYGVVCFAMFFSFTGTVLGGIWADQSWGRFWGWDPKENGALLIVLMNALILHARWGGLVKPRGMAVLAVAGNMVTGWSWFGTNQLGVGLHAYGFNSGLATWLVIFWASQLLFIGLGLLPKEYWRSFALRKEIVPAPSPPPEPPVSSQPPQRKGRNRRNVRVTTKR